eukprot:GGOE01002031.1.p1 GENE.GGOE01002031.1~~GGOE01002031.1.p1  ORF type:complete len:1038 (-),score=294.98 GGOE01002031.1:761-3874(-)
MSVEPATGPSSPRHGIPEVWARVLGDQPRLLVELQQEVERRVPAAEDVLELRESLEWLLSCVDETVHMARTGAMDVRPFISARGTCLSPAQLELLGECFLAVMRAHDEAGAEAWGALWQTVTLACKAFLRATARRHHPSPPIKSGPDPSMTFIEGETVACIFPCAVLEPGSSQFAPVILFITNYQIYFKSVHRPSQQVRFFQIPLLAVERVDVTDEHAGNPDAEDTCVLVQLTTKHVLTVTLRFEATSLAHSGRVQAVLLELRLACDVDWEHLFCFKRSTNAVLEDLSDDSESDTEYADVSDSSLGGDEEWECSGEPPAPLPASSSTAPEATAPPVWEECGGGRTDPPPALPPALLARLSPRHLAHSASLPTSRPTSPQKPHSPTSSCASSAGSPHFRKTHRALSSMVKLQGLKKLMRRSALYVSYDPSTEFRRMVPDEALRARWRLSGANSHYKLCSSYSATLLVPAGTTDEMLFEVASFRTQNRLPIISWVDRDTGCVLARSSQPRVGLRRNRCAQDEAYCQLLLPPQRPRGAQASGSVTPPPDVPAADRGLERGQMVFVDCRPIANSYANFAAGGGCEDVQAYTNASYIHLSIDNIHVMRNSLEKLRRLVSSREECTNVQWWLTHLSATDWLTHMERLLKGSTELVRLLDGEGASVLVHCSDGWDRTSQLTSLVMLILDPYYRTITGFQALVEKEWIAAGHKFGDRYGMHPAAAGRRQPLSNRSPIFLQWMDAVWQVWRQCPTAFEFTEHYLQYVLGHVYSARFGTFLCNNERERCMNFISCRTSSLWDHINHSLATNPEESHFLNTLYDPTHPRLVVVDTHPRALALWESQYFKFHHLWCGTAARWQSTGHRLNQLRNELREKEEIICTLQTRLGMLENRTYNYQERFESLAVSTAIMEDLLALALTRVDERHHLRALQSLGAPGASSHYNDAEFGFLHVPGDVPRISQQPWLPDHLAPCCLACRRAFRFWRRRHHCRACGKVFCDDCSPGRMVLHSVENGDRLVRVCNKCQRLPTGDLASTASPSSGVRWTP